MTEPTPALLFVYGTLRRGCDTEMAQRLASESRLLGPALLRGHLYRIENPGGLPYPGFIPDETGTPVIGDLLALPDSKTTLRWLDAYEEAGPAFPEPQEYRRERLCVETATGTREAWVYVYGWPATRKNRSNGGDWLGQR